MEELRAQVKELQAKLGGKGETAAEETERLRKEEEERILAVQKMMMQEGWE